jgi:hypothetical protein
MAGASIINATVLHNTTYGSLVWATAPLCAVCALLAYGRRQQIKDLAAAIRRSRVAGPGTAHAPASDVMMMSFTELERQALGSIADGLAGSDPGVEVRSRVHRCLESSAQQAAAIKMCWSQILAGRVHMCSFRPQVRDRECLVVLIGW